MAKSKSSNIDGKVERWRMIGDWQSDTSRPLKTRQPRDSAEGTIINWGRRDLTLQSTYVVNVSLQSVQVDTN